MEINIEIPNELEQELSQEASQINLSLSDTFYIFFQLEKC